MEAGHLRAGICAVPVTGSEDVEHVLREDDHPTQPQGDPKAHVPDAQMAQPGDGHERAG